MYSLFIKELITKEFYKKYMKANIDLFSNIIGLETIEYIKSTGKYKNITNKINLYYYKIKSKLVK